MSFQQLVQHASALEADYNTDDAEETWEGSPFSWIRILPPRTKGAIGLRLAESIFVNAGAHAVRTGNLLSVGQSLVAVRSSLEWSVGGFKFEQFKDTNYDHMFCLGLRPNAAYAWLIPKVDIVSDGNWQDRENLTGQHRGHAAVDTYWLSIDPDNVPTWLQVYGGTIAAVESRIAAAVF